MISESVVIPEVEQSQEYVLFGPLGRERYKASAAKLVEEGMENGTLHGENRKKMWERFQRVIEGVEKASEGGRVVDVVATFEEELWKIRQELGTAYTPTPEPISAAAYREKLLTDLEQADPDKRELKDKPKSLGLDDHHIAVERYAKRLLHSLTESAKKSGKELPLDARKIALIPTIMRIHDQWKWASVYGSKDTIMADHEEQIRFLIKGYFVGQQVPDMDGNMITVTDELAEWMADAAGNHENIFEEKAWSDERAQSDEHGDTIGLLFVIDTLTDAVTIDESKQPPLLHVDAVGLGRFTDLAERHLKLFLDSKPTEAGQKNFDIAKAYRPEWILQSAEDFVSIFESWKEKFGVEVSADTQLQVLDACAVVFAKAKTALESEALRDNPATAQKRLDIDAALKRISERAQTYRGGENGVSIENQAFIELSASMMQDRSTLIEIAVATAQDYAKRTQQPEDLFVLTSDEQALLQAGREHWGGEVSAADQAVEMFGKNTVGFLELCRILSMLDAQTPGMSLQQKLEKIKNGDLPSQIIEAGSRGSHAGWYLSILFEGKEEQDNVRPFDARDSIAATSDWLQVYAAADFLLTQMRSGKQFDDLSDVLSLFSDRRLMVDLAKHAHATYAKAEIEKMRSNGIEQFPKRLTEPLFPTDIEGQLVAGELRGVNQEIALNQARLKYTDNTAAFVALQEALPYLLKKHAQHNEHLSVEDLLRMIIDGKLPADEKKYLTTLQKALYLQSQVYKGRLGDTTKPLSLDTLRMDLADEAYLKDWEQFAQAAIIMGGSLQEQAYDELSDQLDLSLEHTRNRPTRLVEQQVPSEELRIQLAQMGVQTPDAVFMFSGGAGLMGEGSALQEFQATMKERLSALLDSGKNVLVVTGGTNSGFMRLAGQIMEEIFKEYPQAQDRLQVLGVTPKDVVTFADQQEGNRYPAAPGHTHHLLVEKVEIGETGRKMDVPDEFGHETEVIQRVLALYGKEGVITNAVVGNGGKGTALEIRALIDTGYPVLLLRDSMRMANLVGTALASSTYEEYQQKLKEAIVVQLTDAAGVVKEKTRTINEINNVFAILRPTDPDVQTQLTTTFQADVIPNDHNFALLKKKLESGIIRFVDATEINNFVRSQDGSAAGAIRRKLETAPGSAERTYWERMEARLQQWLRTHRGRQE